MSVPRSNEARQSLGKNKKSETVDAHIGRPKVAWGRKEEKKEKLAATVHSTESPFPKEKDGKKA